MEIYEKKVTIKELCENYNDNGDDGVFAFNNKLIVRPEYQREFIYDDKKRNAVLDTVTKKYPLNVMYWAENDDGTFEVLDGQQRTISICQFLNGDFTFNGLSYQNLLSGETKDNIDNYNLFIYVCKGTEEEKLNWFRTINISGEKLTEQELLNATFHGTWLSDAKKYFSKRNCVAYKIADGYVKGNTIRQEYLEKVLKWIADRDNLDSGKEYMSIHQHDEDANDLWVYYQTVINWAKTLFPTSIKGITDAQDWGILYNKYHNNKYNSNTIEKELKELIMDDDVTKKSGIIPYILSDRTHADEKYLSIRAFTDNQKIKAYEKQNHKCAYCGREFKFDEMQGDHIIPWSKGGHTTDDNLQMLCQKCNNDKRDK